MFIQMESTPLHQKFECVEKMEVFSEGQKLVLEQKECDRVIISLREVFENGREMPAFGVSLHNETTEAMKIGLWLRIVFEERQEQNGLEFDALIFRLDKVQGVDLIRELDGKMNGRCIHFAFDSEIDFVQIVQS